MAKKNNAIYAPGELSRVRDKLGVTDNSEAKKMMMLLGGEVGTERDLDTESGRSKNNAMVGGTKRAIRRVDMAMDDEHGSDNIKTRAKRSGPYPGDDPSVPLRMPYGERVKIDQYAAQSMFEIKNSVQVLTSIFSFFKEPVDYVNPRFITVRMNEYYGKIERLVNAARSLFPKNNRKRNYQLKRASPFVFKILDVIRNWDIENLAKGIAEIQSRPRTVKVSDLSEVLRIIYKPIFVLDELNIENIKSAFKLIYKVLYIESPMDAKEKYQEVIRNIIASIAEIRRNVSFGFYPLLMKLISDRYLPYERFFIERRKRFMAFLNTTEAEQLNAAELSPQQIENLDVESLQKNLSEEDYDEENDDELQEENKEQEPKEEDPNDPKVIERKAKEEAAKAEQKSLEQGRTAMNLLFPKAGWDKLEEYPDLYPYFVNVYNLRQGYELIAPGDPVQLVAVLLHILEDLFIGLRYVNFGTITGPDGNQIRVSDELVDTLNNWRRYIEDSFSRDYLPRLAEYCRLLENSEESRISSYARKNLNELHWIKRLYFLPFYKFESVGPPPFQKKDVIPIYAEIRRLRKLLTAVAVGIEQGTRAGGAAAKAPCNGINNPWVAYNFQIPNPVSKRLDLVLPPEKRINATLIFFSLSAIAVLDYLVNNENSWAYGSRPGPLFRSVNNEGITPVFGIDEKLDADKIFKESLKKPAS
jgi:flagellar motor protein MotB